MIDKVSEKKIELISQQLKTIADRYSQSLPEGAIKQQLNRLSRRSLEYRNGSFIMLVVGPVKSGKSTLVNLLAHRFVSPTDKLECTVRPSLISNVDNEEDCRIVVYKSLSDNRKADDLDLIIDKLRGIIQDESEISQYLVKDEYALTRENINSVIAPSYNKSDRTIITSITTTGSRLLKRREEKGTFKEERGERREEREYQRLLKGERGERREEREYQRLLKEERGERREKREYLEGSNPPLTPPQGRGMQTNYEPSGSPLPLRGGGGRFEGSGLGSIFIADMPGFDGNQTNISDPLYDAISKRVDLILFVHSSVSAFNVTSNEYLTKLHEYNGSVPVYLIHNVFDTSYWRKDNDRKADIERQKEKEYEEIKNKGFNIEHDFTSCINLGMVTDYVNGSGNYREEYASLLAEETKHFEEVEEKLYNKITTNISDLRLQRCLERTSTLRDQLLRLIDEQEVALKAKKADRDVVEEYVRRMDTELSLTGSDCDEIIGAVESSANRSLFKSAAKSMVNNSMSTNDCIEFLQDKVLKPFLADVDEKLTLNIHSRFVQKEADYTRRINEMVKARIKSADIIRTEAHTGDGFSEEDIKKFMKHSLFDYITDLLNMSHKPESVRRYISNIENYFYGDKENPSAFQLRSLLKREIKRMEDIYLRQIRNQYLSQMTDIITDNDADSLATLEKLDKELKDIII